MKKKTILLAAVFVLAFAFTAFAGFYPSDPFYEAEGDQNYVSDEANTSANIVEFMNKAPRAFQETPAADADAILNAAIEAGPNRTYTGFPNDA
ncbi:MAG: hypothetical protein P9L99_08660 [Candidatus Lernaella stagnicola]|nr:hypothetical protein [Candidatus Lernaella stagnicola]